MPADWLTGLPPPADWSTGLSPPASLSWPAEWSTGLSPPADWSTVLSPPVDWSTGLSPPAEWSTGLFPPADWLVGLSPPAEWSTGLFLLIGRPVSVRSLVDRWTPPGVILAWRFVFYVQSQNSWRIAMLVSPAMVAVAFVWFVRVIGWSVSRWCGLTLCTACIGFGCALHFFLNQFHCKWCKVPES